MPSRMLVCVVLAFGIHSLACAQSTLADLHRQVQERDTFIRSLQERVEALERRVGVQGPLSQQASQPSPDTTGTAGTASTAPAVSAPIAASGPAPRAAGSSDDEFDLSRALERALLREGGILLPAGSFEVEPRVGYEYRGTRGVGIVQGAASGALLAERTRDVHRVTSSVGLRAGLGRSSQVEIRLPFVVVEDSTTAAAAGLRQHHRASGIGDAEVLLTRQLAQDVVASPALLASLGVKLPTGRYDPSQASPGFGFGSLQAALTAVKRQDPLVFVGGLSLTASRSASYGGAELRPGHAIGVRLGTLLAVTPETSLRTTLDFSRQARTSLNGARVAGTSATSGLLEFGLSTLLSRTTLLDVSVGVGITPDAPDLRLSVSLPMRL